MAQPCARPFLSTNVTQYNQMSPNIIKCHKYNQMSHNIIIKITNVIIFISTHLLIITIIQIITIIRTLTVTIITIIRIVTIIITVFFLRMIIGRNRKAKQNCKPAETFDNGLLTMMITIYRVIFFTGTPLKSSKYRKVNLGKVRRCI